MSIVANSAMRSALFAVAVAICGGARTAEAGLEWLSPGLRRLGEERVALQQRLTSLPATPEPQITQRLGWHSSYAASPETVEWVELNLGHAERLDAVVLIAPPSNGGTVEAGYGFPLRFRVELLGDDEKSDRSILADYTRADFPNPGLLPVVIPAGGQTAHKVRITATRLFRENNRYLCALGEVMLLQGERNLGADLELVGPNAVHASSSQGTRPDWGRINVVDGHTAIGPPVGTQPSPTLGFRGRLKHERGAIWGAVPWVSVDLGSVALIEEVRLFPAHPPQFAHSHGYGFPVKYQIELRETEDGPPVILPAPQSGDYIAPPGDNVVTVVAGGQRGRFVRLTALEQHVSNGGPVFALAEIQVWSGGKNIAAGQSVTASDFTDQPGWSPAALVDGYTSSADIVDWPMWLAGLSQRREVEQRVAVIELRHKALVQRWQRGGLIGLASLVGAGVIATLVWLQRQRRLREAELEALRQRIARDLHDEIGSSLGSIALIAQDILADGTDVAQVRADLGEIKEIADETVSAMRDITRLIQSDRYGADDLATLLRETAGRLLRGVNHTLTVEEGIRTRMLPVDCQRDLILMFKETLHNITRHAGAKTVSIQLAQNHDWLTLTVCDDGRGFDSAAPAGAGMGLTNLQRRAAKHGGSVQIASMPAQGTTVSITLPHHA